MPCDFTRLSVLVTAGPTWESMDPVRLITSRSSGKMGYAIARSAAARGAKVTLVSGPVALDAPAGIELVRVETALEMERAVLECWSSMDLVVMAAAVADFRPIERAVRKQSKREIVLDPRIVLVPNPDILAELGQRRRGRSPMLVGFAAETEPGDAALIESARAKLLRKKCDLICANNVGAAGAGFQSDTNRVLLIETGEAEPRILGPASKDRVADLILDRIGELLGHAR